MSIASTDFDSFGVLLRTLRKRRRLTQQQLAKAVGMHRHAISRWEQGDVLPASKAIVLELASCLRLNEQETRQLLDASLSAPAPLWGVPFPRNQFFTGREKTLEALYKFLPAGEAGMPTRWYALQGLGGVGKTQVALEYAYRHALEYRAIFWIEAESLEQAQVSLRRITELLNLPECSATESRLIIEAVQHWLANHDQWLLIWNNLEDLELPFRLLPPTRQGALLLTTRQQTLGTLARGIALSPMEQEDALLLLLRRAKVLEPEATAEQVQQLATRVPAEYAAAVELVTSLGGLPLALDQAGAFLEETGCRLSDYLHRYTLQRAALLDRRGSSGSNHPQSVAATFRLSQEQIEREQQGAADLLRVCAFLHAEAIPEDFFRAGAIHLGPTLASLADNPTQFDLMLATLRNLSLVQRQAETHTFSLHRLVQVVLQEQMDPAEKRLWSERTVRMVNAAFPKEDFASWIQCERYLLQALACIPLSEGRGKDLPEASELLSKAGRCLMKLGRLGEAETYLAQAIALIEQHYGPEHPALISPLANQVELLWRQGNFAGAEAWSSRTLAIEEQHLEPTHLQTADTLNTLAVIYIDQGKYELAEQPLLRALHIWELHNHPDTNAALNNLAILYRAQGKYEQAEVFYQQALQICEHRLGPEHPEVAFALGNLAVLYRTLGKYEQAEPLFLRALHIHEEAVGLEHPDAAFWLGGLAILYREQGKYEQAEPLFRQTLSIREKVLGPNHPTVAITLSHLAALLLKQGKYEQAEEYLQRALALQEQILRPEHIDIAFSRHNLATVYKEQNRLEQAEALYQKALSTREKVLGIEHADTISSLHGLATVHKMMLSGIAHGSQP